MEQRIFAPAPPLRPYIDSYSILSGRFPAPRDVTLLPDGGLHLILNMGEPILSLEEGHQVGHEGLFLVGTMLRREVQRLHGAIRLFAIRFHPGGFTHFYAWDPLHALANRFEAIGHRHFVALREVLGDFPRAADRFFLERLAPPRNPLRAVAADIEAGAGEEALGELASRHGYGERTLEREFRRQIGVTPRDFQNLARFKRALLRLEAPGRTESLSRIAHDCGYCDQAHMTREFRRFAGSPPSRLILSEGSKAEAPA